MTDALKYELMRIRTIRSTWWLTILAILFGTAISFLVSWGISEEFKSSGDTPSADEIGLLAPMIVGHFSGDGAPFFIPYFLAMVGVFAWGHEYRHGMIRATLTALPSRTDAWVAKYLVVGAWVVLVTLVTLLVSALGRHHVPAGRRHRLHDVRRRGHHREVGGLQPAVHLDRHRIHLADPAAGGRSGAHAAVAAGDREHHHAHP